MCVMKQSDQILSRRFLCSLVLRIKRQAAVPFYFFAFRRFWPREGRRGVKRKLSPRSAFIQKSRRRQREKPFSFFLVPVGRAGRRTGRGLIYVKQS